MHTKSIVIACVAVAAAELLAVPADPLARFWRENDGKTVRRLPVDVRTRSGASAPATSPTG